MSILFDLISILDHRNFDVCQTAKDVEASQDMLIDLFVRIEGFFRRLESYTEVRPTAAMTNIIVKIMVEILTTLAIATKDIKQRRASELIPGVAVWPTLTYTCLEKYVKQLLGKNEIEGSLKRLDTLTQEEARMAIAEILRVTHSVNDNVRVVLDGAQDVIFLLFRLSLTRILPDGKDAKDVMQRTAHDVNEVKRWSHSDVTTVFPELNYSHRDAVATGPSKVALPTGPLDKSQHRPQFSTRGDGNLVLPEWFLRRMEVNAFPPVDSWETYVPLSFFCCAVHRLLPS